MTAEAKPWGAQDAGSNSKFGGVWTGLTVGTIKSHEIFMNTGQHSWKFLEVRKGTQGKELPGLRKYILGFIKIWLNMLMK